MQIVTNRMNVDFNIGAINRDFAFLRLERQAEGKNWYGASLLDSLLGGEFNAAAVLYRYSRYAYVMFRRPVDLYALCCRIRNHPAFQEKGFDDGAVRTVQARVVRDEEDDAICEAWLLQILFNSLASSRSDKYPELNFCNLTGRLLLMEKLGGRTRNSLTGAEIAVTNHYLLDISVHRFRKMIALFKEWKNVRDEKRRRTLENLKSRPRYEIHGGRGVLKRVLPEDPSFEDGKKVYIQCGEHRRRVVVPFLDFTGREAFAGSRAGIYQRFLERVGEELSEYAAVSLLPRNVDEVRRFSGWKLNREGYLKGLAAGSPFHIVDCVRTHESGNIASILKKRLFPDYTDLPVSEGREEREDGLNFRIIHNAAYYETQGLQDDYLPFDGRTVRQHLTVEDIRDEKGELASPAVRTMVKEALIKRDLARGRITLFDWSSLETDQDWIFGIEGETRGKGRKRQLQSARFMIVRPDGSFEMKTVPAGLAGDDEYQRYIRAMQEAIVDAGTEDSGFEGLIARNGQVNCIFRTREITLPDLDGIARILDETGRDLPEGKSRGRELAALVGEFMASTSSILDQKGKGRLESLRKALEEQGNSALSKTTLRRLINDHIGKTGKLTGAFRKHLREEHGILLIFSRSGKNVENLLPALCEIQYFEESGTKAWYFVGEKKQGIKRSIKSACHLRRVTAAEGSGLIFRDLLPTMDVDFVRTGQSTVVPFVFKYLREFCSLSMNSD